MIRLSSSIMGNYMSNELKFDDYGVAMDYILHLIAPMAGTLEKIARFNIMPVMSEQDSNVNTGLMIQYNRDNVAFLASLAYFPADALFPQDQIEKFKVHSRIFCNLVRKTYREARHEDVVELMIKFCDSFVEAGFTPYVIPNPRRSVPIFYLAQAISGASVILTETDRETAGMDLTPEAIHNMKADGTSIETMRSELLK